MRPPRCANSRGRDRPPEGVIDVGEHTVYTVSVTHRQMGYKSAQTDKQATKGVAIVYYLRLPDGNIKIGTSRRPLERLATHRRESGAHEVLAVEFGGFELERERHQQFSADRVYRREHFRPSDALMAHIQTLREALNLTA